ncbi:MAG: aminotransferase class I/II-fold pyridoxal phosphate-dependent enzyme, partial [bacterium]|nr:aminotransferase class I/II-fold pyridoxal phosphate-dependent enzyme [bacterium]
NTSQNLLYKKDTIIMSIVALRLHPLSYRRVANVNLREVSFAAVTSDPFSTPALDMYRKGGGVEGAISMGPKIARLKQDRPDIMVYPVHIGGVREDVSQAHLQALQEAASDVSLSKYGSPEVSPELQQAMRRAAVELGGDQFAAFLQTHFVFTGCAKSNLASFIRMTGTNKTVGTTTPGYGVTQADIQAVNGKMKAFDMLAQPEGLRALPGFIREQAELGMTSFVFQIINPMGALLDDETAHQIAQAVADTGIHFMEEYIYTEMRSVGTTPPPSIGAILLHEHRDALDAQPNPHQIVTVNFSCSKGDKRMAGYRVGYCLSNHPEFIESDINRTTSHVSKLGQTAFLAGGPFYGTYINEGANHAEKMQAALSEFSRSDIPGLRVIEPKIGGVMLVDFQGVLDAHQLSPVQLSTYLFDQNPDNVCFPVILGSQFMTTDNYARVSVTGLESPEQAQEMVRALRSLLDPEKLGAYAAQIGAQ